jgi:hemerythrin
VIEWEDKFSVGISIIDEEHKKLIGLLNKVVFAKGHNDNPEEIREVLRKMINYAITHFATEETYMKKFNY